MLFKCSNGFHGLHKIWPSIQIISLTVSPHYSLFFRSSSRWTEANGVPCIPMGRFLLPFASVRPFFCSKNRNCTGACRNFPPFRMNSSALSVQFLHWSLLRWYISSNWSVRLHCACSDRICLNGCKCLLQFASHHERISIHCKWNGWTDLMWTYL